MAVEQSLLIKTLRAAILQRQPVVFSSGATDHDFSPHALGTRQGIWHVYGWDSAASPPGWRCLELRTITSNISIRDGEWQRGVRAAHSKSKCLHFVYAEVDSAYDPLPPWAAPASDDQDTR